MGLPPPPNKPLPAVPTNETIDEIFKILETKLPSEIVYKILFTQKGLIHPIVKIIQPSINKMKCELQKRVNYEEKHFRTISEGNIIDSSPSVYTSSFTPHFNLKHIYLIFEKYKYGVDGKFHYSNWYFGTFLEYSFYYQQNKYGQGQKIYFDKDQDILSPYSNCFLWRITHSKFSGKEKEVSVKELKAELKMNNIKGYSKLNKEGLIRLYLTF